jgi:hypothetical protein
VGIDLHRRGTRGEDCKILANTGCASDMAQLYCNCRGVAQFGLARSVWDAEVGGSNPLTPTSSGDS